MKIINELKDGALQVALHGNFTFKDNADFRGVLEQIGQANVKKIILDASHLEFIDSAGLGMLLLLQEETKRTQKELVVSGLSGQVKRVFAMAKFDQLFTVKEV